jgi:V8-like Glu-specific endopeptidase
VIFDPSGLQEPVEPTEPATEPPAPDEEFEIFKDPNDDRVAVRDTMQAPYRFICHLEIEMWDPTKWVRKTGQATGVLITPKHVLTSAHNLRIAGMAKGKEVLFTAKKVVVSPGRNTSFDFPGKWTPFGKYTSVKFNKPSGFDGTVNTAHLDYAVITLKDAIGDKTMHKSRFGYWSDKTSGGGTEIRAVNPATLPGKRVKVCGYPGDKCGADPLSQKPECLENRKQGTQFVSEGLVIGVRPSGTGMLIAHRADMEAGQSGGPLWIVEGGKNVMIGLQSVHTAGDNFAVLLTDKVLAEIKSWT